MRATEPLSATVAAIYHDRNGVRRNNNPAWQQSLTPQNQGRTDIRFSSRWFETSDMQVWHDEETRREKRDTAAFETGASERRMCRGRMPEP